MPPELFMRRAIALSREKMEAGAGGPFGAVIVKDGAILAEGWNCVTSANDPTAHAEIVAIREAAASLGHFSLAGCEIYTSCEPCPMCLSAIYWSRIDRIYYANDRVDAGRIGFDDELLYREFTAVPAERRLKLVRLLAEEAEPVFAAWKNKPDKRDY
jgi:guanine deaminase